MNNFLNRLICASFYKLQRSFVLPWLPLLLLLLLLLLFFISPTVVQNNPL
jgi:hypothetical protein